LAARFSRTSMRALRPSTPASIFVMAARFSRTSMRAFRPSTPASIFVMASALSFACALRIAAFSPISLRAWALLRRLLAGVLTFSSASAFAARRLRAARAWYAARIFRCASSSSSLFF